MAEFIPKSTSSLRPGHFWAVPLDDGRFACGRVLQLNTEKIPTPKRAFFGGLHDWVDDALPTSSAIAEAGFIAYGVMHIKAITETGGQVLGECPLLDRDDYCPVLMSSQGGPGAMILQGSSPIRLATKDEWGQLPVLGMWGYTFIKSLAEAKLASR